MDTESLGRNGIRGKYLKFKENLSKFGIILFAVGAIGVSIVATKVSILYDHIKNVPTDTGEGIIIVSLICVALSVFSFYILNNSAHSFICSNCLKTVEVNKIKFSCPFCDKEYAGSVKNLLGACDNHLCKGVIQYIECYHCKKPIDLFTTYDEDSLKRRRYE